MTSELLEAAKDMLRYGEHDGDCTNDGTDEPCEKHLAATAIRQARLEAAIEAAEKAGEAS